MRRMLSICVLFLTAVLCMTSGAAEAAALPTPPSPPELLDTATLLLGGGVAPAPGAEGARIPVHDISAEGDSIAVCLEVPIDDLASDGWLGMERIEESVRNILVTLNWQSLSVQALDVESGTCRPLSDFTPTSLPDQIGLKSKLERTGLMAALEAQPPALNADAATMYPASLAGKIIYISAGHGWFWNGSAWRTQRIPYQSIIEDHNNAEAVTQYLIPYLENAGATVMPVRERDWSASATIADNDAGIPSYVETGSWSSGASGTGYAGGTYRYAISTEGGPTATATWALNVAEQGTFAVYAWVYPGSNRVPDAHYTVHHAGGSTEVLVDQRIFPNTWRYLGTFPFYAGPATVQLDNRTTIAGGPYAVIADAIKIGGGTFDSLSGLPLLTSATTYAGSDTPGSAPYEPWWETSTFYWSQHVGLDPYAWEYYNDVVARPMMARWYQRAAGTDALTSAVYISWHTNGYNGTIRGTESYVHMGTGKTPRTEGSLELQAAVHDELIHDIRAGWDPAWVDRGKKQRDLGEVRMLWDPDYASARIPGVLLEIAFHDNYTDALALKDPGFNQLAARAIYQGIVAHFDGLDGLPGDLVLAPEPPTHLRVENTGAGSLRVAWQTSPTDAVGLRGDAATAYHVYTSIDGFAWGTPFTVAGTETLLSGLSTGDTRYVKVTGINAGGESFPTEVLGARVGDAALLIVSAFDKLNRFGLIPENDPVEGYNLRMWVDRMNSYDYVVHHGQAVPAEYAWDSASNEAVIAGSVTLGAYDVVDWILGEETTSVDGTFNSAERALVDAYLTQDRALMVSGSEFGWELEELGGSPDFLHNTLHTDYVADDAATYTARPVVGGAFSGLGDLSFDAPGEYDVDYPDVFGPLGGAQIALTYVGGSYAGQGAAIQYAAGCRRLLVLGFPFETLWTDQRPV
jgi:N-acetylmuramoyl-L-alanine amidase